MIKHSELWHLKLMYLVEDIFKINIFFHIAISYMNKQNNLHYSNNVHKIRQPKSEAITEGITGRDCRHKSCILLFYCKDL